MGRPAITLRIIGVADWRLFRAVRLSALAEAPYAFCSTLADWRGEHDVEERWRRRVADVPFNAIAYLDGSACGMVSATEPSDAGVSELISMWVSPAARGRAVASALVDAVVAWARERGVREVSLDVREANGRARAFYRRCGFVDRGRIETDPGVPPERRMARGL
jgi:ribosomal protein S18 acetylase RimI-like enzyme